LAGFKDLQRVGGHVQRCGKLIGKSQQHDHSPDLLKIDSRDKLEIGENMFNVTDSPRKRKLFSPPFLCIKIVDLLLIVVLGKGGGEFESYFL